MKAGQIKHHMLRLGTAILGDEHVASMRLARNFRHYRRAGIIFVHVPKNAGTSVSAALYGTSLGHVTARRLRAYDAATFDRLARFAVLRDPVARARSAWLYAREGGTDTGWALDRPEYRDDDFQTFDRFAMRWLPARDPATLDLVFQPQVDFLTGADGRMLVDTLIPLRQLSERWPALVAGRSVRSHTLPALNRQNAVPEPVSEEAVTAIRTHYAADQSLWDSVARNAGA